MSCIQVQINVTDKNDNAPQFTSYTAEYTLSETTPVTFVLTPVLTATDDDAGDNSVVSYYLTGEGVPSVFDIDSTNGQISLQSGLNHEVKQNYSLILYAVDSGTPEPQRSDNVTVIVMVSDFNDNPPVLNQSVYNRTVYEVRKKERGDYNRDKKGA